MIQVEGTIMTILVTGGCGYIGSHTVVELLNQGYDVVIADNLCNSSVKVLDRIVAITGKSAIFVGLDITDKLALSKLFTEHSITAVIHFAALKAVGESSQKPHAYYQNNVHGTLCLLEVMASHQVHNIVFSSSATVYGEEAAVPYRETMRLGTPSSPYGASKVMVERILQDTAHSNPEFRAVSLRYFNPIGAHPSGQIGEDPHGIPNNLLPFVAQVAVGKRPILQIFGDDYPTEDGTCKRDYLHVVDLAKGHLDAIRWFDAHQEFRGVEVFNLGTGKAVSVLEIVHAFCTQTGVEIPYEFAPRREGDLPQFWADASKAKLELGWTATLSLAEMMTDTWRWQSQNPDGY